MTPSVRARREKPRPTFISSILAGGSIMKIHPSMLSATVERVTGAASIWATFQSKFGPETVYDAANFKTGGRRSVKPNPNGNSRSEEGEG